MVVMVMSRMWGGVQQGQNQRCCAWVERESAAVGLVVAAVDVAVVVVQEGVAAAEWAAVQLSQEEGGVWKAGVREVWTAGEVHDALVFQTERAFCVLFVVRRWVTRVVAVEGMGGVEFGGC